MPPPDTMDDTARTDPGAARRDEPSAGALLRAARERQGMHIATLAAAIKVTPRKLEALERDRWDELPGPTFTRALAQAVCRALKTDPQPVMELLPAADTSMLDSTFGAINEPFVGPGGREPGLRGWIPRGPWLIAAIVLLVAAALVIWLPAGFVGRMLSGVSGSTSGAASVGEGAETPATGATAGAGGAGGPVTVPLGGSTGGTAGAGGIGGAAPATPPATATTTATTVPGTRPAADAPAAATASASPTAEAALPAGELVIQCNARSWVEVIDARGRVLLSRNIEAGESIGLDGAPPLQVVVGNAAATQVSYKGKPVEVEARARDNVARFELR